MLKQHKKKNYAKITFTILHTYLCKLAQGVVSTTVNCLRHHLYTYTIIYLKYINHKNVSIFYCTTTVRVINPNQSLYCLRHGACNHCSRDCRNKLEGHQDDATFENRMGGEIREIVQISRISNS